MFRSHRASYVKKETAVKGCVFCKSIRQGVSEESLVVYKDKNTSILLNKYPYNSGHLLVIPNTHTGDFLKVDKKTLADLQITLRKAMESLEKVYRPHGMNVGLNLGASAGAGIPDHLHYHVIPRWNGDTNFFPVIAKTKAVIEDLDQTYKKISKYFGAR